MNPIYYKPSGKAPISGIILALAGGAVVAVALSIVYIALQWFIPFIYINVVFTLLFSVGLAGLGAELLKRGKIRNMTVAMVIGIIISLVAFYSQWALFISLTLESSGTASIAGEIGIVKTSFNLNTFSKVFLEPKFVFASIKELNEIGTFSLKRTVVSGTFLWIVWIIEALIILGSGFFVRLYVKNKPYSETCDKWLKETSSKHALVTDTIALKKSLEEGKYSETLQIIKENPPLENAYSEVFIYALPEDRVAYISILNVTKTQNGKDEKVHTDEFIKLLRIPYQEVVSFK